MGHAVVRLKAPNVALSVTLAAARPLAAAPLTPSRHLHTFGAFGGMR